jgi:hypothetical protein
MGALTTTKTVYKVSDFLSWQKNGELELSSSFQRRSVWSPSAKSYLIDTIIRGLPIPLIFLRDRTDVSTCKTIRVVVDGQQRIRTVLSYVAPTLLIDKPFLIKKAHNSKLADKSFQDLPVDIKETILTYEFPVHVLPSNTDDKEVLKIFARMNATGVKLNGQELRNAEFSGEFKLTVYDLAYEQLERWRDWKIFTEMDLARMNEVEMTSDLVLLIYEGISAKAQPALNNLYKKYDNNFKDKDIIRTRFSDVLNCINDLIGTEIAKTEYHKKTLFYILFALIYDLQFTLNSPIKKVAKKSLPKDIHEKLLKFNQFIIGKKLPHKVRTSITARPTNLISRKTVYEHFKKTICG